MRAVAAAAMLLLALPAGIARAEWLDLHDLYREAEAITQSLLGTRPADVEIIHPPAGIDPRMALVPPRPTGTMRIIPPPGGGR